MEVTFHSVTRVALQYRTEKSGLFRLLTTDPHLSRFI